MAKSRCKLCGAQLKGGDGIYRKTDDGNIIKICVDRQGCQSRMRAKTMALGGSVSPVDKSKWAIR